MSSLAETVAEKLSTNMEEKVAVSGVVVGDSIGYPKRVVKNGGETKDGELSGFDEAYDYACSLFKSDSIEVEEDEHFIWFTKDETN